MHKELTHKTMMEMMTMGKMPKTQISKYLKNCQNSFWVMCFLLLTSTLTTGCAFKPLYGPTASNQELTTVLAGIEIPEVPGRVGQRIRNELIYQFTGGGHAAAPQYKLVLAVRQSVTSQLVKRDGDSRGQIFKLTTTFNLYAITDNKTPLLKGKSNARATFIDDESIYANVRSRRDAEDRTAKTTADDIQGRIAAYLSSNS